MTVTRRAIILGLIAGVVGGMFGVGGGIIMVPGLVLWLELDQHTAHATSVATIIFVASAAMVPFAIDGEVRWDFAGWILIGALIGSYLGARLISRIPAVWLARGFVVVASAASIRFLVT